MKTKYRKTSCGYHSSSSCCKACKGCGFPLAMSISRFALWIAVRKVEAACCVFFMAAVLKSYLFVYMTPSLLFPLTSQCPMLPLSNNFSASTGLTAIDPVFWHPSDQGSWIFPESHHQWLISAPMGPNATIPYVSYQLSQYMLMPCIQQNHTLKHEDLINIIQQATEHNLTASGNATYMQLALMLAQATNEKAQLKGLKCSLEEEVIHLQTQLQTIEWVLI